MDKLVKILNKEHLKPLSSVEYLEIFDLLNECKCHELNELVIFGETIPSNLLQTNKIFLFRKVAANLCGDIGDGHKWHEFGRNTKNPELTRKYFYHSFYVNKKRQIEQGK